MSAIALLMMSAMNAHALEIPHERYVLPNGLTVILHEDHTLPQVVINLWYDVGSKDEVVGRTGFAHLFEHLMFMGTTRLPDSGYDDLMEGYGGWNNAWTSEDATDYYDVGPSNLVHTFLWMETDRMEGLAKAMNQEKLDLQRDVVRNERRQSYEDAPYGQAWLALNEAMYPAGHPYAHSVIGSHEDLAAAQVGDVVAFFDTWYVPNNASLVVAGDFNPDEVKLSIERTFGTLQRVELPTRPEVTPVDKPVKSLVELTDQVSVPKGIMLWHSPGAMKPGDADMDLLASVLGNGRSSRLYSKLVHEMGVALEVSASQYSQELTSLFVIEFKPAEGHTIEELEGLITAELERLMKEGPTPAEMDRARNAYEMSFLQRMENLDERASALNRYQALVGTPDYLDQDLARYTNASAESVRAAAATLTVDRRCIIRVRPAPEGN